MVIPQRDCSSLEADFLYEELRRVTAEVKLHEITGLIVDFSRAPFFGSTMLGGLIRLWKSMAVPEGRLVLCCLSPNEHDVMSATRLDSVWGIFATRDAALSALSAN